MKIYFAGGIFPIIFTLDPRHILTTFNLPNESRRCIKNAEKYGFEVILDSGAFSAWNSGRSIDRQRYLEFILQMRALYPKAKVYPVNLDVIPGKQGEKITKSQVEESAHQGWENYEYFKKHGIESIHVFHEGEDFKWLHKMIGTVDYIGVSPCNDSSLPKKVEWCKHVFHEVPEGQKTHGFAVTSQRLMKTFPWYSVDSASWAISAGLGNVWTSYGTLYFGGRGNKLNFFDGKVKQKEMALKKLVKEFTSYPIQWTDPDNPVQVMADVQMDSEKRRLINFFFIKSLEDKYNEIPTKGEKYVKEQFELF